MYKDKLKRKNIEVLPLENYINARTKILHKCTCGNEWYSTPSNILKGRKCGCRSTGKINNIEWYINKLKQNNIRVLPLEIYIGSKNKILHKCICGNEWKVSPNEVLNGHKCGCTKGNVQTKSHIKYLSELQNKDIKIIPLEPYQGSKNKILHKCTCGNEWLTTPARVVQNKKCGCAGTSVNYTNKWYLSELQNKDIKIIPLEPYQGSKNKILHKCTCGNEWLTLPSSILNGVKCGCNLRGKEFYKGRKTILYYIKIKGLYKIGITLYKKGLTTSMNKRFQGEEFELIQTDVFEDGSEAFTLEQRILEFNKDYIYLGEKVIRSGNTELFIKDIR